MAAGLRRTVARGAYAGICIDGYRVVVTVGPGNRVSKHLEIGPERAPLIRDIFAMAMAGRTPWEIAEAVTAAGWSTVSGVRLGQPKRFEAWGILRILNNPRYAGLSPWKGAILAAADWPAYITAEQFEALRVRRKRTKRSASIGPRPTQPYLLIGVARCGLCHCPFHAITGPAKDDGSRLRTYRCSGHVRKHCNAQNVDAAIVDAVFIEHLATFSDHEPTPKEELAPEETLANVRMHQLKNRISHALARDDLAAAGALFEELRRHTQTVTVTSPTSPEHDAPIESLRLLVGDFHAWAASALDHPEQIAVADTERLRGILKRWFTSVELQAIPDGVQITPINHRGIPGPALRIDYGQWRLSMAAAGYHRPARTAWTRQEVLGALRNWGEEHGEPPATTDWSRATGHHPMSSEVFRHFGSWRAGLLAAGFTGPRPQRQPHIGRRRDACGRFIPTQ